MIRFLVGFVVLLVSNGLILWSVKRRGYWLVNTRTGEAEWIPGKGGL